MTQEIILILHTFTASFMMGVVWLVQVIHYPLYYRYDKENFVGTIRQHLLRISIVTVPVMVLEMITGIWLVFNPPLGWVIIMRLLLVLLLINWISTLSVQAKCHIKLLKGYDERTIRFLVLSNWIRTFSWTLRSILLFWLLHSICNWVPGNS